MSIEKRLEEMAVRFREMYPPGTRLLLLHMDDTLHPMPSGIRGTVESIDDQCQITTVWDNGSVRRLQPDNDSFRKLTDKELEEEQRLNERQVVQFGDECTISIPKEPIDCSKLGYFDELEYDCWDLIKKYCERLGIKIESGDISFDIAKGIQDHIIEQFQEAGVNFNFEDIDQVDSPVMKM